MDVARLLVAATAVVTLAVLAVVDPGLPRVPGHLVSASLSAVSAAVLSVVNAGASLAVLGGFLAGGIHALRFRRFALTSAAVACGIGAVVAPSVAWAAGLAAGDAATLLLGPPRESAGLPVTAAVALIVGADLHRRPWAVLTRVALAVGICCALALGSLSVPSAAYALLVGATAGLAARVALGVVPARPSDDVVRSVLDGAGWQVTALRPLEEAPGQVRYAGVRPEGGDLRVTVVDPDRRGVPFARRLWRLLRLRTAAVGRPALSLRGHLERQALSAALAQSAGVAAPQVLALLAAGPALVMVDQPLVGTPLSAVGTPAVARGASAAMSALRRLHDVGLAHGALTADRVLLLPDGRAGFTDLAAAQPAATDLQRDLDVVALLVAAAQQVDADGAVAALRSGYGTDRASEARLAALMQPLALLPRVRHMVRRQPILQELRTALTGSDPGSAVAAPRLERFRSRTVISVAAGTLAAYLLAGQLSQADLVGALENARLSWLVVALLGSAVTYVGAALALQAFVPVPLPLSRTALVQVATSFVTLVTPPAVGHVGLNIRYLQRAGVHTATAAASVAVKEAVTVVVTVPLLLVCGWLSGVSASRLTLLPRGDVLAVLAVLAAALAVLAAVPPTRRLLHRRLEPLLRRTIPQLLATAGDLRRLTTAVAGILVLNAGFVLAMDASLRAFSASLPIPTLVVVFLAASTLGSAAPTPGGLGAVEAALVAGLSATGVPVASALPAVLMFRAATFWLPAPIGWAAFVALQRRGRL